MPYLTGISILAIACLAAYGLSRGLTGAARHLALRFGVLSQVTHRSSHTVPTPRLGGIGLALGFGLAAIGLAFLMNLFPGKIRTDLRTGAGPYLIVFAGWLAMFGIGLLDDLFDLPALLKLVLTVAGAAIPVVGGYFSAKYAGRPGLYTIATELLRMGAWTFWILFFVNAFNFMDGMDGFAASFARLSAVFFFAVMIARPLFHLREPFYACALPFFLPLLAAACGGFLHWNYPPARVFMGDGGSLSTGYLLAVYVFLAEHVRMTVSPEPYGEGMLWKDAGAVLPLLTALTILLPFIFDVVLTLIRRARRRENIMKAHREHLYQRLMKTGLGHAEVLRLNTRRFWAINLAALLGALPAHPAARWAAFLFALMVMAHYWRLVLARESRPAQNR